MADQSGAGSAGIPRPPNAAHAPGTIPMFMQSNFDAHNTQKTRPRLHTTALRARQRAVASDPA
eukprot:3829860-Pyramimonas_sp.AAC.1